MKDWSTLSQELKVIQKAHNAKHDSRKVHFEKSTDVIWRVLYEILSSLEHWKLNTMQMHSDWQSVLCFVPQKKESHKCLEQQR